MATVDLDEHDRRAMSSSEASSSSEGCSIDEVSPMTRRALPHLWMNAFGDPCQVCAGELIMMIPLLA